MNLKEVEREKYEQREQEGGGNYGSCGGGCQV